MISEVCVVTWLCLVFLVALLVLAPRSDQSKLYGTYLPFQIPLHFQTGEGRIA
ncbi:uncharacterized protein CC84DRAFT_1168903 [Paraphaeosphaeria sporulosa]|uniref:Uncharacterized protein n=1 Tax=Paraphaeosphaeria sporulosa TaxID=1460663 RepID=A0A177BZI5_9PLEO|nr:uncharacterized protein CC84DRAFT_1168903 [Paraphaeosphaeria sporulosa]OAG00002.1 hypothetical protein CC84DRAFT_1168903 [Paraphaeosphaeria sporulosa]